MLALEVRRFFRSARLLTVSGIIVLGIGIGASSLTLSLLLGASSLAPSGMLRLGYCSLAEETGSGGSVPISWQDLLRLRNAFGGLAQLSAYSRPIETALNINGTSRTFTVAAISSNFFSFVEPPSAGRVINATEEQTSSLHSIVLSEQSAVSLFGSPSNAIGHSLTLNGLPFEVTGVASRAFQGAFGENPDAFVAAHDVVPLLVAVTQSYEGSDEAWKVVAGFYVIAGSSHLSSSALSSNLTQAIRSLNRENGELVHSSPGVTSDPLRDERARKWLRLGLLLSLALTLASGLNYSLLLLARLPRYLNEVHLKSALGATLPVLLLETVSGPAVMMCMSILLGGAICFLGLRMSSGALTSYGGLASSSWHMFPLAFALQIPFALCLTALIAALPVAVVARADRKLRSGINVTMGRREELMIQLPVVAQIALCGCVWILAGMVISASTSALRAPLGYNPANLKLFKIGLRGKYVRVVSDGNNSFPSYASAQGLLSSVASFPGVRHAALTSDSPFGTRGYTVQLQISGHGVSNLRRAYEIHISPGYFDTMGTRILLGRPLTWHGTKNTVMDIVISEALSHELWQGKNPIGQPVNIVYPSFGGVNSFSYPATVVGVAENARFAGVSEASDPVYYSSIASSGATVTGYLLVDGTVPLSDLEKVISNQLPAYIPEWKLTASSNVLDDLSNALRPEKRRLYAAVGGVLLMGSLTYIGLFGTLTYYVHTKRRDLAIRICLGASPLAIRTMILRRAAMAGFAAILLSAIAWPLLARLSANEYLGSIAWSTGRAMSIALASVAMSICVSLIPARTATHISPSSALKEL